MTSSRRSASGHGLAAAHGDAIQERSQRSIETSGTAILDPAALVAEALDPPVDSCVSAPVRLQCPEKLFTVEQPPKLGQIHRLAA
jgi:hypothetical protein